MRAEKRFGKMSVTVMALIFLAFALPVFGQSIQYGKVTGRILLVSGEPLPGVSVEISGTALMSGKQTTVTANNGSFIFLNLPGGKYKVSAALQGFKTALQQNVVVSAATVTTVDLVMETGNIEETVTVVGKVPVLDIKTSAIDTKLNKELLEKLPTSRDAFYDLSITTPGMFSVGKDSSWLPSPTAYSGATNENIFLVNGVDTTNPRGASWGSRVNVNYNAVEEVRVISLGSKAEYGSFSGVAVDVLTKSGSNEFHGNLGLFSKVFDSANNQPAAGDYLGTYWTYAHEGDSFFTDARRDQEFNVTLGGPLVKNKIWFFTGFDWINRKVHEPNFEPTKDFKGNYFDLKLTAEPFKKNRAWVAYHFESNRNDGTSWGSLNWDPTMVYSTKTANHTLSAQWQLFLSDRTVATAKYLGFWTNDLPDIPEDAPDHPGYINWWKWVPTDMGVNGAFHSAEAQKTRRTTIQADISHYAEDFLGEHDIKFGVQHTAARGDWFAGAFFGYLNYAYPKPWTQSIEYLQSWYGYTALPFYVNKVSFDPYLTVRKSSSLGVFLDDQWSLGKRLTLNIGLRYDRQTAKFGEGEVYEPISDPQDMGNLTRARMREGSDNVFDFKTFSPRIGLTYMLTKDAKTAFKLNYGRYYAPISLENLGGGGPDLDPRITDRYTYEIPFAQVDLNNNGYIDGEEVVEATRLLHNATPIDHEQIIGSSSWKWNYNPDMKNQHTDQFTVGLERELARNFSIAATYIYRNTGNIIVRWPLNPETGEPYEYKRIPHTTEYGVDVDLWGVVPSDYNHDGVVDGNDIDWIANNVDFIWRNMPDIDGKKARRLYQGFQLVFNKRYADRWQLITSLLFSYSDGFASRSKRQDINIEGPNIVSDAWLGGMNQTVNNMEGPLPYTPKFELKISGSYTIPKVEIDLGFRFRYNSGRAIWPLEDFPKLFSYGGNGEAITTGETYIVSIDPNKPFYYPAEKILDLHLEKSFRVGKGNIRAVFDIFNVFNEAAVTNATWKTYDFGRVVGITYPSRSARLSFVYEF